MLISYCISLSLALLNFVHILMCSEINFKWRQQYRWERDPWFFFVSFFFFLSDAPNGGFISLPLISLLLLICKSMAVAAGQASLRLSPLWSWGSSSPPSRPPSAQPSPQLVLKKFMFLFTDALFILSLNVNKSSRSRGLSSTYPFPLQPRASVDFGRVTFAHFLLKRLHG